MDTYRGRRRLLALAIGCLATAPVLAGIEAPARAATTTVIERGMQYVAKQVDVAPGDSVVWTFESSPSGSPGHTVTFDDGTDLNRNCPGNVLFNDCQDTPGETVQRRFSTPGTYPYSCKIHRGSGMVGVVVVSAGGATTSTTVPGGSTSTATVKSSTTTTTRATSTSSTTATTRVLATSSTMVKSTTTTSDSTNVLLPGEAPPFSSDDTSSAAGKSGDSNGGSDSGTVALIVGLLLAVSAGGGYLLWRLRPGRT